MPVRRKPLKSYQKAFTLIELLVVISDHRHSGGAAAAGVVAGKIQGPAHCVSE
jgi:hypothetical protein